LRAGAVVALAVVGAVLVVARVVVGAGVAGPRALAITGAEVLWAAGPAAQIVVAVADDVPHVAPGAVAVRGRATAVALAIDGAAKPAVGRGRARGLPRDGGAGGWLLRRGHRRARFGQGGQEVAQGRRTRHAVWPAGRHDRRSEEAENRQAQREPEDHLLHDNLLSRTKLLSRKPPHDAEHSTLPITNIVIVGGFEGGRRGRPSGPAAARRPQTGQPLNLQRQVKVQVERLQEKIAGQGEQSLMQRDRSSAQFKSQGQAGHEVVTPSQVTDPRWPAPQLLSVAEQLVVLLLPEQLTVLPSQQFAEAVQSAFSPRAGRLAAGTGATGLAREAMKAWSAALSGAARAGDARKPRAARARENPRTTFFTTISFLYEAYS